MIKIIIYKIKNKENGKIYIGQTTQKLNERLRDHICKSKRKGKKTVFHSALKKYTISLFDIEVIDHATSLDELNEKEEKWIKLHNSLYPNGYNLQTGGKNKKWNDLSKEKLSNSKKKSDKQFRVPILKFDKNGKLLFTFKDTKEAMKNGINIPTKKILEEKKYAVEKEGYLYTRSFELFNKYIDKEKERRLEDIIHFDKNKKNIGEYKTTLEMEKVTLIKNTSISMVARGKQKVFEDNSFVLYRKDVSEQNLNERASYIRPKAAKKIKMYNETETFIFKNSTIAAKNTGLNRQLIAVACKMEKFYKNYNWEYV